jgi:hypothetical protein
MFFLKPSVKELTLVYISASIFKIRNFMPVKDSIETR